MTLLDLYLTTKPNTTVVVIEPERGGIYTGLLIEADDVILQEQIRNIEIPMANLLIVTTV